MQFDNMPLDKVFGKWFTRFMRQINNNLNLKSETKNTNLVQDIKAAEVVKNDFEPVVKNDLKAFLALFKQYLLVGGDLV